MEKEKKKLERKSSGSNTFGKKTFKITLLGSSGVGKTAFAVRYLTNRFIGEYDRNKDVLYKHRTVLDREEVLLEIQDTAYEGYQENIINHIKWADGVILMFSVIDRDSYDILFDIKKLLERYKPEDTPLVIVANKMDLTDGREVSNPDMEILNFELELLSPVVKLAVAENAEAVHAAMEDVLHQIKDFCLRNASASEKRSALLQVKEALKRRFARSRSDTV